MIDRALPYFRKARLFHDHTRFIWRLRLSIDEAVGVFWKAVVGGQERWIFRCHYCHGWRNYMRKMAGSPLEIQINLSYRFPKSIPTLNSLSEIAWSSWQRTLLWTLQLSQSLRKRGRAMAILQSKILNNSSFRNRKTILTWECRSKNHSHIVTLKL